MKLQFEAAWDRAIAPADRQFIENLFDATKDSQDYAIIRTAKNYKNQLLISVLINNRTTEAIHFKEQLVRFQNVSQAFTTDAISIPPYTSMPWTFIFDATKGYNLNDINPDDFELLSSDN